MFGVKVRRISRRFSDEEEVLADLRVHVLLLIRDFFFYVTFLQQRKKVTKKRRRC